MSLPIDPDLLALQGALAGQYAIERELGRGGMGIVYLAREVVLDRLVALKVLPRERARRPEVRERFLREARTAARLAHPHIVPIHRVESTGEWTWFAMGFVDGETLAQRVQRTGPLPAHEATRLLREVAWALAYAHAAGIVHRDVKPENILLDKASGRALVTDFGIAHVADGRMSRLPQGETAGLALGDGHTTGHTTGATAATTGDATPGVTRGGISTAAFYAALGESPSEASALTAAGHVLGTAHYMSPEQAVGDPLDGRSDLYALGAVAHFALTGRVPFDADTTQAVMLKQLREPAPALASRGMPVPEPLARAVDRCLAKRPDDRWPSLEAFADALAGEATTAPQTPAAVRIWMADQSWLASVDLLLIMMGFGASIVDHSLAPMGLGAIAPVLVHATARLVRTRTLLGDGYSLSDIRRALAQRLRERDEEVAYNSRRTRWGDRFVRLIAGASAVATVAAATIIGVIMSGGNGSPPDWLAGTLVGGFLTTAMSLRVMFSDPASRFRLRDMSLRARDWLWRGAGGDWMTRIAGWRLRRSMDASALRDRPTEVALGIAAEDLYRALSAETRKALGDLPSMLRELEGEATRARAELAHAVGADADRHRERLQGLVAALESVRLDLLKLTAGTGTLHAVTAAMSVAARLADATDRGAGALDETRRLVGGVDASLLSTPV